MGQLVKHFLKERHRSSAEYQRVVHEVMGDRVEVEKWVWSRVTDRMYDENDCQKLGLLIQE